MRSCTGASSLRPGAVPGSGAETPGPRQLPGAVPARGGLVGPVRGVHAGPRALTGSWRWAVGAAPAGKAQELPRCVWGRIHTQVAAALAWGSVGTWTGPGIPSHAGGDPGRLCGAGTARQERLARPVTRLHVGASEESANQGASDGVFPSARPVPGSGDTSRGPSCRLTPPDAAWRAAKLRGQDWLTWT